MIDNNNDNIDTKYKINKIETHIALDFAAGASFAFAVEENTEKYKSENNYILDEKNIKLIEIPNFLY